MLRYGSWRWVTALTGAVLALLAAAVVVALRPDAPEPAAAPPRVPSAAPSAQPVRDYLLVGGAELAGLPTRGGPWSEVVASADPDSDDIDLAELENEHAASTVAAGLVFARTGDQAYRADVVRQLEEVAQASLDDASVLSVARQLAGYVIAADLVGYDDPGFRGFVSGLRTRSLGGHDRWKDLTQTSEDTASNWGTWALASRIAVSRYLADTPDVARSAQVFRGYLGDREAHDFRPTLDFDPSYVCGRPARWVPVNPPGCGELDGALVEDISRSSGRYPDVDEDGLTYSWEGLGGATLSAALLARGGYPDVHEWSGRALLRAARFLERHGGYPPVYSVNQYIPWAIRQAYDVEVAPLGPAGSGRQYGFTDWLP